MKIDNHNLEDKVFIIAELSANHGHDIEIAKKSILAAKNAGADAVKIQTYTADTITIDCNNEYFRNSKNFSSIKKLKDIFSNNKGQIDFVGIDNINFDLEATRKS